MNAGQSPEESASETPSAARESEPPADTADEDVLALREERDELHDKWLRARAELENYRKRARKELSEAREHATLLFVRDLLPALDNLHRAIDAAATSNNVEDLLDGVKMVAQQFEQILERHSVKRIEALHQPFDPNLHEAIQHVPSSEHPAMMVIGEAEHGYVLNDRVVRPSKVIVSSGPPSESEADGSQ